MVAPSEYNALPPASVMTEESGIQWSRSDEVSTKQVRPGLAVMRKVNPRGVDCGALSLRGVATLKTVKAAAWLKADPAALLTRTR